MNVPRAPRPVFRFVGALWCVALIAAHAQDPVVHLRLVSFPKVTQAEPVELLVGEGKTMKVEIPTNSLSETYTVPALSTWALGKSSADREGKFIFDTYGSARSIGKRDQLLLVVRKGAADSEGFEVTPIEISETGFSGGKYFLMNAARVDIGGTIGTAKFALKPNAFTLLAPEPTKTKGDRKYSFAKIFFRNDDEIQPFFSSTWRFNEKARSMVFFYHDPTSKKLRIHTIRSFVE